jgi:hypothetical protein
MEKPVARDCTQHQQHEQDAGGIECRNQRNQIPQRPHAIGTHREDHGAKGTDGSDAHDNADDAEKDLAGDLDGRSCLLPQLAQARHGNAGEKGDEKHLQQFAPGKGAEVGIGNDGHQMGDQALVLGPADIGCHGLGIEGGEVDIESGARMGDLAHQKTDAQRDCRDRLEIEQGLQADAADLGQILHRGDAVDDGAEDDRRDHHPDQLNEPVAQRFQGRAGGGEEMADEDAEGNGDQDLDIENAIPGTAGSHGRPHSGVAPSIAASVCQVACWIASCFDGLNMRIDEAASPCARRREGPPNFAANCS